MGNYRYFRALILTSNLLQWEQKTVFLAVVQLKDVSLKNYEGSHELLDVDGIHVALLFQAMMLSLEKLFKLIPNFTLQVTTGLLPQNIFLQFPRLFVWFSSDKIFGKFSITFISCSLQNNSWLDKVENQAHTR